jgi:predicted Zn-dependent peptidase
MFSLPQFGGAMKARLLPAIVMSVLLTYSALTQDISSLEKKITVKKLANGLTVILMERPEAPVFSFFTYVNAGSVQDPMGKTGLAHMMEHMAFKGTDKIGTRNYPAEKAALDKVEQAYLAYNRERLKTVGRDDKKLQQLKQEWENAIQQAQQYVVPNQFGEIVESNGGEGMNAFTSDDTTGYNYSMPANRLELWAYLESERFLHPVMREFYKERNVVIEERRMRVDSSPFGRLFEQFTATAFAAHPYHRPTVGWISDLNTFSATDALNFFERYYVPSNMVIALVGDVKVSEAMPIIEKYFGRLPTQAQPEEFTTAEPPQNSVREVVLHDPAQPVFLEGYHRPSFRDKDDAVYDAIADVMSNGRTSRLYRSLVRDKKIASIAGGFSGLPGYKYPHLFAFFGVPVPGHKNDEIANAIHSEIDRIKTQDITDDELKMIKTRAKANLLRGLDDNAGLAQQLATFQALFGDWRELFYNVDRIDKVSKADVRRVANQTFVSTNRTVGTIETMKSATPQGGAQ